MENYKIIKANGKYKQRYAKDRAMELMKEMDTGDKFYIDVTKETAKNWSRYFCRKTWNKRLKSAPRWAGINMDNVVIHRSNVRDLVEFEAGSDITGTADKMNTAGGGVMSEMAGVVATMPGAAQVGTAAQFTLNYRALQQTMTSYSGPGFRSFQWQFSMKPLTAIESMNALGICNYFKTRSMPAQTDMQFTRCF